VLNWSSNWRVEPVSNIGMEFEVSSTVNDSETVSASLPQFCSCLFIKLLFNDTVSRCKVLICSISFLMSHPFLLVLGSLNAKLKKVLASRHRIMGYFRNSKLCYCLDWILRSGTSAVFVYDGLGQPQGKRMRAVIPDWIIAKFKRLVDVFGFYSHTVNLELKFLARLHWKFLRHLEGLERSWPISTESTLLIYYSLMIVMLSFRGNACHKEVSQILMQRVQPANTYIVRVILINKTRSKFIQPMPWPNKSTRSFRWLASSFWQLWVVGIILRSVIILISVVTGDRSACSLRP